MKTHLLSLSLALTGAVIVSGRLSGAVIVLPESTANATAYSTNYTTVVPFASGAQVGNRPSRDLMQTFTVGGNTTIHGLELVIDQANATRGITLNLYDVAASSANSSATQDLASLSALRSEAYAFTSDDATNTATAGSAHLLQWTFSSLALDSARTYALMIADSGASEINSFRWLYNGTTTTAYAGGAAYGYSGSGAVWNQTLFAPSGRDLTLAVTTVPEPTASTALGLGFVMLALRRRRVGSHAG